VCGFRGSYSEHLFYHLSPNRFVLSKKFTLLSEVSRCWDGLYLGVAKSRLAEFMGKRREVSGANEGVVLGVLTLGQCISLYLAKVDGGPPQEAQD
jgi:hypothetical protein